MRNPVYLCVTILCLSIGTSRGSAAPTDPPIPVAILNFQSKGEGLTSVGQEVSLLLGAFLSENEALILVEREELQKSLEEIELSLSGTLNPDSAARIGHLTGAKALVTGSVFEVGNQIYVVSKLISVETSRVFGETEKLNDVSQLEESTVRLSEKISTAVIENRSAIVAEVETSEERVKRLKKVIGNKGSNKTVFVSIPEQHLSRAIKDPAVENEILLTFQKLGFDVTLERDKADFQIVGEAFSEAAGQRGQLVSCRSRAEIKLLDKDAELISVDRQTEVGIDLAENIAAKTSLQKAGSILAERLLVEIAKTIEKN